MYFVGAVVKTASKEKVKGTTNDLEPDWVPFGRLCGDCKGFSADARHLDGIKQ